MDKNLISIDDLVRQRLGGGEEQERSGAWLQMRDLLDKEMPQVRPGGIYWRRMFSAVAALLLIATVSIGSYKLYNSSNDSKIINGVAVPVTASNITVPKSMGINSDKTNNEYLRITADNANKNNYNSNNNKPTDKLTTATTNSTDNKSNKKTTHASTIHKIAAKRMNSNRAKISENVAVANKTGNAKQGDANHHDNINNNDKTLLTTASSINGDNNTIPQLLSTTEKATSMSKTNVTDEEKKAANDNSTKNVKNSNEKALVIKNTGINNKKHGNKKVSAISGTNKTADNKGLANTLSAVDNKKLVASNAGTSNESGVPTIKKTKTPKAKSVSPKTMTLSSHIAAKNAVAGTPSATNIKHIKTLAAKNVNTGTTVVKKNNTQTKALAGAADTKGMTAKNSLKTDKNTKAKLAKEDKIATKPANGKTGIAANAGNKPGEPISSKTDKNTTDAMRNASAINLKKGKKVIEKMEIYQHLIKSSSDASSPERRYQLDTMSIETITEQGTDDNSLATSKKLNRKTLPGGNIPNDDATDPATDPGAASPANKQTPDNAKNVSKKKSGISLVENLQAKFNDIKYNIATVQFVPGLTAGINGTFFGPNSFKGFQFGLSGDFVFNDNWSVLGELKYIHRVNSNYAMNDNYNTYRYNNSMQAYEKDSFVNQYSFSTLHSFELPISVKYTKNKFSIFGGGNFAYTLGVNPGDGENPLINKPIPPQFVAVPGKNSGPAYTPADLESARFGIGYLFGFAYKVAPNIVLDFRNVQTLWDNASGAGSRFVSSQLYKSPSLQFSLTYRFGGEKQEEKP